MWYPFSRTINAIASFNFILLSLMVTFAFRFASTDIFTPYGALNSRKTSWIGWLLKSTRGMTIESGMGSATESTELSG
jgi:hypothetical protein